MKILAFIKAKLNNKKEVSVPQGYCPNCWGRQEYQGKLFDSVHNEGINKHNINSKIGWIQAYTEKYLSGIQLQQIDNKLACRACQ